MSLPAGNPGNEGAARYRVVAAIGLIALAALLTIRWSIQTWGQVAGGDEVTQFLARCQRLGASLPATGRMGYIVRPQDAVLRNPFRRARLTLPHPLGWHLATSLDRLIVQFWPMIVFTVVLRLRAPVATLYIPGRDW